MKGEILIDVAFCLTLLCPLNIFENNYKGLLMIFPDQDLIRNSPIQQIEEEYCTSIEHSYQIQMIQITLDSVYNLDTKDK